MKGSFRRLVSLVIVCFAVLALCGAVFCYADEQGDFVLYDLNEEPNFKGRTRQDVADKYYAATHAAATYDDDDSSTWYKVKPSLKAPYAYGELTADTHLAMQEMTNFYRWLVGTDPLMYPCEHTELMQAGAFVRNFHWTHFVSNKYKPDDMDDEFWNYGAKAPNPILARGSTPVEAITNWINEGFVSTDNGMKYDTYGHREGLIDKDIMKLYFGHVNGVTTGHMNITSFANENVFTAFPSPGCVPDFTVHPKICGWGIDFDISRVDLPDSLEGVKVTIENMNTGETFVRTKADGTINSSVWKGYNARFYFAQPEDWKTVETRDDNMVSSRICYTDPYKVTVSGLVDVATGKEARLVYTVDFTDLSDYLPAKVTKVKSKITTIRLDNSMLYRSAFRRIAGIIPDEVTVTTSSGKTYDIKVKGEWEPSVNKKRFTNHADLADIPANVTDEDGLLDNIVLPIGIDNNSKHDLYIYEDKYSYDDENRPDDVLAGSNAKISLWRYYSKCNRSQVYKVTKNEDGSYSLEKRFDSKDSEDFVRDGQLDTFTIKGVTESDAGQYFSVYFKDEDSHVAVISNRFADLKVVTEREEQPSDPTDPVKPDDPSDPTKPDDPSDPSDRINQMGEDGTPIGNGASYEAADKAITKIKKESDPAGSKVAPLFVRSTKQTKKSIKLTWKKPAGAVKFVLYGNKCGKKNKMKKIKTLSKTSVTVKKAVKKLAKGKYYKFIVVSLDKDNNVVSTSKIVHVCTKGGKAGNFKSVKTKAKKNKVTLKVGKTFKLAAKGVPASKKLKVKKHVGIRYETSDKSIATISSKGIIKAVRTGTCSVYAYTQNGAYAKIKVVAK